MLTDFGDGGRVSPIPDHVGEVPENGFLARGQIDSHGTLQPELYFSIPEVPRQVNRNGAGHGNFPGTAPFSDSITAFS